MGLPDKGEKMMLAEALEPNILVEDHLVIFDGECLRQVDPGILVQPLEDFGIHPSHAVRGFDQSFPIGILADGQENLADGASDPFEIHVRRGTAAQLGGVAFRDVARRARAVGGGILEDFVLSHDGFKM
jgi:hypothetical protein